MLGRAFIYCVIFIILPFTLFSIVYINLCLNQKHFLYYVSRRFFNSKVAQFIIFDIQIRSHFEKTKICLKFSLQERVKWLSCEKVVFIVWPPQILLLYSL